MRLAVKLSVWVVALVVLTLGFLLAFLAMASDDFYRRVAKQLLEQVIDRQVRLDGTFSMDIGMEPTLVVTDLWLENAPWAETTEMARLDRVEVQVALQPLLSGVVLIRRVVVEGLTLDLETARDGRVNWDIATPSRHEEEPETDAGDTRFPLVESISLKNISLTHTDRRSDRSMAVLLASLDMREHSQDDRVEIVGEGRVNARRFTIGGRFGSIQAAMRATAPYPFELSLALPGLEAVLSGTVASLPRAEGFDLALSIHSPSIGTLLDVLAVERALEGHAEIAAHLAGDLKALALTELTIDVVGEDGQRLQATGSLANLTVGTGLDIDFSARVPRHAKLLPALPAPWRHLADVDMAGRLTGSLERPTLADFTGRTRHTSGAELSVSGGLTLDLSGAHPALADGTVRAALSLPDATLLQQAAKVDLPALGPVQISAEATLVADTIVINTLRAELVQFGGFTLTVQGSLGTLSSLATGLSPDPKLVFSVAMANSLPLLTLAGPHLPELGPMHASGRLVQRNGELYLDTVQARLGSQDRFWVELAGGVGPIRPDQAQPVTALAATLRFGWPAHAAPVWLGGPTLRELGAIDGRIAITGTPDLLHLPEVRIAATLAEGLEASATGAVATIALRPRFAVMGLALDVNARSATTAALAQRIGQTLPELGALSARGRLRGGPEGYALHDLVASAGPADQPFLRVTGDVGNVLARTGVRLRGAFRVPTARLVDVGSSPATAKLGRVQGQFELSDTDGSLGLEALTVEVVESTLLTASLEGVFDDIVARDQFSFQATWAVPNPEALGHVFGIPALDLGPLAFAGRLAGNAEALQFDGEFRVGQTAFTGTLSGSLAGARPALKARLTSPRLYFADFGLTPKATEAASKGQTKPRAPGTQAAQPVFSAAPLPFEALQAVDVELAIVLEELDGVSLDIDQATLHLVLANGVLTIDPLRFTLVNGMMQIRAVVDTTPAQPTLRFEATIDDLDLGDFLGQLNANVPLDGEIDMILTVQAVGRSPDELADSLNGKMEVTIERGAVRTGLFGFTALDLGSWLFARSTRRGYSELNCFIARFDIVDGEAETVRLLLDTRNVRMSGHGVIELDDERLKLDFAPKAKRRRIVKLTTPFSIEGPLSSPRVVVKTSGVTGRVVGEVISTPINLLGRLLPLGRSRNKDLDNPCLKP